MCDVMKAEYDGNAMFQPQANIQVRREYLLEDAFAATIAKGVNPLTRYQVQFVDQNFQVEDGLDGGGLFKEFMTLLTAEIFDTQYANFTETEKDRKLYPNILSAYNDP